MIYPYIIRKGHYVIYKDGRFALMMQANEEVITQIINGSQKYHPIKLDKRIIEKCDGIEKLTATIYQVFMLFTYNTENKELRHDNKKLFNIIYLYELQDLFIMMTGRELNVKL